MATPSRAAGDALVDREDLVAALQERHVRVEAEDVIRQPFFNAKLSTRLVIAGGPLSGPAELQVYEYTDLGTLAADAAQVSPDGNLQTAMIQWIATPHFFCSGQVIVLYLGDDQAAIGLLSELLGPQFAGG